MAHDLDLDLDVSTNDMAGRLWQELARAPHDRHHDWRTPVLATQGLGGSGPQARTVVLRHADASQWRLQVFTDGRSPKCAELRAQPLAQLSCWSKRLGWQLRVAVQARVHLDGALVASAWDRVRQSPSASDYTSHLAPGSAKHEPALHSADQAATPPAHHLAVLDFQVVALDWLSLDRDGHKRAKLTPDGVLQWLVP